jgi:hypothetical protein
LRHIPKFCSFDVNRLFPDNEISILLSCKTGIMLRMSSNARVKSEECSFELDTLAVSTSEVIVNKLASPFLAVPSADCRVFSEDLETWANSCFRPTMDETHGQFLPNSCQVSRQEPVKIQSEICTHVPAPVLGNLSTLADDWFGQQGGDLAIDSSLEGLFQNEDIADFTSSAAVPDLPLEELLMPSNNSSSTLADFASNCELLPDKKPVLACDFTVDATSSSKLGETDSYTTDASDVSCTASKARKSGVISPPNQYQKGIVLLLRQIT